jgi:hypothetical protein
MICPQSRSSSRRASVVLIATCCAMCLSIFAAVAPAADQRGYTAGHVALQIGTETVFVHNADGGDIVGTVVEQPDPAGGSVKKHISAPTIEPIRAAIQPGQFDKFLREQLTGKPSPVNGAVIHSSYDRKVVGQTDFSNAVLTELQLPVLDGTSKEPCTLGITLEPESVRNAKSTGGAVSAAMDSKQKSVLASNFRVQMPGLTTTRVRKIDPITLRRKSAANQIGEARDYQKSGLGPWTVSNVILYVPESDAQSFLQWHEQFVVQGKNSDDQEKSMTIDVMDASTKNAVLTLQLDNVGIVSAKREGGEAGSEQITTVRVEMYAERATLTKNGGGFDTKDASSASAPPPPPPDAATAPAPADKAATAAPTGVERPAPTTQIRRRRAPQ